MREACEKLRLLDENGMSVRSNSLFEGPGVAAGLGQGKNVGRLYRIAMEKKGIYTDLVPIEYARAQTDYPRREGWDHDWTR